MPDTLAGVFAAWERDRPEGREERAAGGIVTNRLDVPAEVIAFLYQRRRTIEIFFRFLKHILGCRHLLSTRPAGVAIQAYCAIIACLLIALWSFGHAATSAAR